eukprot:TRINITY_DN775893_c0_g1_i1.p1 TRINITY_DN775893_c0_g1~~TRINITY_DN775893_c0_g1_i1.p1  ORF type:complete len:262 (+),score=90.47 TRINITY_DN775893_c0_g1_i1:78-788(+)
MAKNILIVYAHPEAKSFNGAMKDKAVETLEEMGHKVTVSDLYAQKFNPVSSQENFTEIENKDFFKLQLEEPIALEKGTFCEEIKTEMKKVEEADLIILQFPLWWFSMPAIMKGWVDRVFARGFAYGSTGTPVLAGKLGMVSVTSGGPMSYYGRKGPMSVELMLLHITHGTFGTGLTGLKALPSFCVGGPARMTDDQRKGELERWGDYLRKWEELKPVEYPVPQWPGDADQYNPAEN